MIATTIEQSNKLLKLGLDPETSDMYWQYNDKDGTSEQHVGFMWSDIFIPAWSLSALMETWPKNDYWDLDVTYFCSDVKGHEIEKWAANFYDVEFSDMENHEEYGDTPTEAAYKLTCWLLEHNLIINGGIEMRQLATLCKLHDLHFLLSNGDGVWSITVDDGEYGYFRVNGNLNELIEAATKAVLAYITKQNQITEEKK